MKNEKQQLKMKNTILYFAIFVFVFFNLPSEVFAARLFLETTSKVVGVGQELEVTLYLDSEGETINALEGKVHIPSFMSVEEIRDGNSFISFWSERPQVDSNNIIVFSGVIPGGWQGTRGFLFSFIGEIKKSGSDVVTLSNVLVLLHDGEGTAAATTLESLTLSVDETTPLTVFPQREDDSEPPEPFTPFLTQDPDVFLGDYFLVFATQDKNSGIDHYEVLETRKKLRDERKGNWRIAKSPYRLNDQSLRSFVYIRAIDRAGNIQVTLVESSRVSTQSVSIPVVVTLIILLSFVVVFMYKKRRKQQL